MGAAMRPARLEVFPHTVSREWGPSVDPAGDEGKGRWQASVRGLGLVVGAMRNLLICAAILAAPLAAAGQPLPVDELCLPAGLPCSPRSCEPAIDCRFDVDPAVASCAVNMTIAGRTCQTTIGAGGDADAADTGAYAGAELSNGSVSALNLRNSWLTPTVHVDGRVAGTDLGHTSVGAYKSDILTEDHAWFEVGLFVRHDSDAAREGVLFAFWFLDTTPDGCFVRTQSGLEDVQCPSLRPGNYVPLLP